MLSFIILGCASVSVLALGCSSRLANRCRESSSKTPRKLYISPRQQLLNDITELEYRLDGKQIKYYKVRNNTLLKFNDVGLAEYYGYLLYVKNK